MMVFFKKDVDIGFIFDIMVIFKLIETLFIQRQT